RQTRRRTHTYSRAVQSTHVNLGGPNLLATGSYVYVKARAVGDCQCTRAVRRDCVDSYPSGGVDGNGASDVHRAEGIIRRAISVKLEALHNGFWQQGPTKPGVPVEGPQVQAR